MKMYSQVLNIPFKANSMNLLLVIILLLELFLIDPPFSGAANSSAIRFNGQNNFIQVSDNSSLRVLSNITVEAWIKPTGVSKHHHVLGKNNYEIAVEPLNTGFKVLFEFSSGGTWRSVISGQFTLNQWYHVAGTYDGRTMRLFVNGTQVATAITTGNIDQTANPFRIGSADGFDDIFLGTLDEVRLSNVVRYTANFPVSNVAFTPDGNTKGLWHLDEGSGTTTADASGNNNNGTLVNSPTWTTDSPFTGPDTTPPVISAVTAKNLLTTSGNITWATDEPATSQVEYGPTPAYGSTTVADTSPVTAHSQSLAGLTANTNYNYRVISKDATGNQAVSPNLTFTTPATDPLPAPVISNVTTGNITGSDVTITWLTDVPADSQIAYGTTSAYGSSTSLDPAPVTNHSQVLNGLTANTTYHYQVKSQRQSGESAVSADGIFTTANPSASTVGQWSAVMNWPLVAVNVSLLHTGDILMWDTWSISGPSVRLWNPNTQAFTSVPTQSSVFCAGQARMADGRLLVVGGNNSDNYGIKDVNIFNPVTKAWTRVADMNLARWYPSVVPLPDGRMVVIGGLVSPGVAADPPEVYDPASNTWTLLAGARLLPLGGSYPQEFQYPQTYLLPDGKILMTGGPRFAWTLDVAAQKWSIVGASATETSSSTMYSPGKFLATGGGSSVVTTAQVLDMNQSSPAWRQINSMSNPRYQHNLVSLPDGKVLAIGGADQSALTTTTGPLPAEMWDPLTENWTTMASISNLRGYHSTALLLPDGRVLSGGGGDPGLRFQNAQIYSPPYLFKGTRPTITNAPATANYNSTISVDTPDAANIVKVSLMGLGAVTHTLNMNEHNLDLSFTRNATGLTIQTPANLNNAPPGHYMLFLVNSNGVPSMAKIVQMNTAQADTQSPAVSVTAPADGASISGTSVTLTANASDNVGVASVQFLLDGLALGSPDTTSPYSLTWDSTTATNGSHNLTAQAKDAAGNTATSSPVGVSVANPQLISNVGTANLTTTTATINWTTNQAATSQVEYGTTAAYGSLTSLDSALVTGHSQVLSGLTSGTLYHYRVRSIDAQGNPAVSGDASFTTASNAPVVLVGDKNIEAQQDYNPAGVAEAFQYTATASGTASKLYLYLDASSTATKVVVGVYTNTASNTPGNLLGQATITTPQKGAWNNVTLPGVSLSSGQKYWIAVLVPTGSGTLKFRDVASGGKAQVSSQSDLTSLPATWSSGATYPNSPLSAYVSS